MWLVYDPRELTEVTTARPGVAGCSRVIVVVIATRPLLLLHRRGLLHLLFFSVIIGILTLVLIGSHCALNYEKCRHSGLYGVAIVQYNKMCTTVQ
jgi:hypothetical protein